MKNMPMVVICICLAWLAEVAAAQDATPPSSGAATSWPQQAPSASKDLYRLYTGDVVEIRFFFQPELNEQVQIRPDGRISMQLVGDVQMAGKTVADVSRELEQAYASQLKNARISVQVRIFAAQKVYVTGEVVHPGVISMPGELTVLTAIGEAGGIKPTGKSKSVVLIRKGPDDRPVSQKIVLRAGGKPTAGAALLLRPYDIIIVPESNITQVDRWVDQYVKQLDPGNLVLGFSYVLHSPTGTSFVPF